MARFSWLPAAALALVLLAPSIVAAPQPAIKIETGNSFSRVPAGSTVTYKVVFDVTAADGQSAVTLNLAYKEGDKAVAWNAMLNLRRIGASSSTNLPALSGFDQPVVREQVFEGRHELTITVRTSDEVASFASYIEIAATKPDGSGRTAATYRHDFVLETAPDDDNDGLSNAVEAEWGTDPKKRDTDGDGLTDCQEVKHTSVAECERKSYLGPYDGGYGTDPKKADTDGDGLRDDVEARSSTDPLKADTDGDGLNDCQETRHTKASECGKIASTLEDGGYKSDPLVADEDKDGLLEGEEVKLGSDIFNPDSDGDGLLDGEEAHGTRNGAYGNASTDPTKKDTDGDGVSDFDEIVKYGTDPNKKDTDGDGLLDADEVQGPNSPVKADSDDDGLNDFEERMVHKTDPVNPDTDGDGLSDGDEVLVWKTRPLDPDTDQDGLSDGDEVALGADPHNHDTDADGLNDGPEVHEFGTDPALYDTDGDGLGDGEEVHKWKTDPVLSDTDQDQLSDGNETVLGTDPLNPDTDGDGWLDGVEVRVGSGPLDPASMPSDVDGDMIADVEDDDADGDGRPDDEVAQALSSTIGETTRISNALGRGDVRGDGTVEVHLRWSAPGDAGEVQVWKASSPWTMVARVPASDGAFAGQARDGDLYRITAVVAIGDKIVGADANATWFEALPRTEVFVTGVKEIDAGSIGVRNGDENERAFAIEVQANGKTTTQEVLVASRSQESVDLDLSGVTGAYTVFWNDGGERIEVMQGEIAGEAGSGAGWLLWAGLAALVALVAGGGVAFVRMRKN